jgi:hypothetical protein
MTDRMYCQECGKFLNPHKIVWLGLSTKTGEYYFVDNPGDTLPEDESQGAFPFGKDCAKKVGKLYKPQVQS